MVCKKEHRYDEEFKKLPDSQAGDGRHLCAACAYEQGINDAKEGKGNNFDASKIKKSQAGTIRHKDARAAYELGYSGG